MTASKPIVTLCTLAGSPPSPRTIELRTASSDGRPVTPDALALEVARARDRRLGDHGGQRALHERPSRRRCRAPSRGRGPGRGCRGSRSARARPSRSLTLSVEDDGAATLRSTPSALVVVALQRQVDARRAPRWAEVEHQRGRLVRAVLASCARSPRRRARRRGRARARTRERAIGAAQHGSRRREPAQPRRRVCRVRRRVTFSRNVTLSLSRTCRCYCKYCAFATHRPHLHAPDEVERAARRRRAPRASRSCSCSPARRPTINPGCARASRELGLRRLHRLRRLGLRAGARARPAAAHEPRRARRATTSARLREVTASQGLMLESVNPRPRRPPGLADQAPGAAAGDDPRRRRAADPVHERDPRRHRRVRAGPRRRARGAGRGARRARPPAGGDPAELRPAPALLRRGAGRDRRRGGRARTGAPGCRDAPRR